MGIEAGYVEGLVIDTASWRGRRVLLTGHTGFKGAWLSLWLQTLQAQTRGLALDPTTSPSFFELAKAGSGMEDLRGDIRNLDWLKSATAEFRPEIVFHMAAQSLVRSSYADPIGTYATNIMGTAHVLEAVRSCGSVRAVLIITSDKCYENREDGRAYAEDDAMGGYDPYSSSKGCAELVTAAYRQSYFNPDGHADHGVAVASARAGNVIGGGDWARDRLIPDAMRAFLAKQPLVVRFPQAVRPWQHVLEPLSGYLRLAERLYANGPAFAQAWNFGPDAAAEKPVRYLAERVTALWGEQAAWVATAEDHAPHEAHYLSLDAGKARTLLEWRPRLHLDRALELTVDWYKAYRDGGNMREFSISQIDAYVADKQPALTA
ncbi:MAG TPA: CDP-glucose 4,6-dehydratase [Xanthobacteraceae bacterium]